MIIVQTSALSYFLTLINVYEIFEEIGIFLEEWYFQFSCRILNYFSKDEDKKLILQKNNYSTK